MLNVLKTFYRFLLVYKASFWFFVLLVVLSTVAENLNPYVYKLIVDAIPARDYNQLIGFVFLFIGTYLTALFLEIIAHYVGDRILIPAARDARLKVFQKVQDLDFAYHSTKSTGSLISAFKRGDGAFFDLFHNLQFGIFRTVLSLVILVLFFGRITPLIAFFMLFVFLGNSFIGWQLIKRNIKSRADFNDSEDEISGIITDNLINYETVKYFAQEKNELQRLTFKFTDWSKKLWRYTNSFRMMDLTVGTISNLGMLAVFWIVIRKLVAGEITTGDFVLVASFTAGFYYRFFELIYNSRSIAKNYADIERYFAILDNETIVKDPKMPVIPEKIDGRIIFEDVSFGYPDGKNETLADIDLDIKPGESVAFVGRSGAGKTTIVRLMLRFYDVAKGKITIDGIDLREMSKSQLRSYMGLVPQEPVLFNNTLGYNLSYGKPGATQGEIEKVVKMANLYEFINSLPEKYETQVGERGIKLSGGQKQRLAIARMLLVDPKIIIFDEATSNLDSESERLIQDSLWKIAKGKTVIIIAHRFSTIRRVDRIVVLDKGKIIDIGSHEELKNKEEGLYRRLWMLQARGDIEVD